MYRDFKHFKSIQNNNYLNHIQANILQVGKSILDDHFEVFSSGYGRSLAGFGTDAALAGVLGSSGREMLGAVLFSGAVLE